MGDLYLRVEVCYILDMTDVTIVTTYVIAHKERLISMWVVWYSFFALHNSHNYIDNL